MFYIMAHGLPGSGKSTIFAELERGLEERELDYWSYNRDDLRTEVAGESYHEHAPYGAVERRVNELMAVRRDAAYARGAIVLDDNTNLNRKTVNSVMRTLPEGYELVHAVVPMEPEVARHRNEVRGAAGGRRVPDEVIERMYSVGFPGGVFDYDGLVGDERRSLVLRDTRSLSVLYQFLELDG